MKKNHCESSCLYYKSIVVISKTDKKRQSPNVQKKGINEREYHHSARGVFDVFQSWLSLCKGKMFKVLEICTRLLSPTFSLKNLTY